MRSLNGMTTKVVTEQTDAVEVTGQIVDLDARIRNLRASESALQAHRREGDEDLATSSRSRPS